jgi:hypothetical protein
MGELAARLGSIVTYDRRGDVVFYDDFSCGLSGWYTFSTPDSPEPRIVAYPAVRGRYAVRIETCATNGETSYLVRNIPHPALSRIGLEVAFIPTSGTYWFMISLLRCTGTTMFEYSAWYEHATGKVWIGALGGNWILVGTPGVQSTFYNNFVSMKLVVDLLAGRFTRLLFNQHRYDVSGYSSYSVSNPTPAVLGVRLMLLNWANSMSMVYVDDVIVTQNEPAGPV